MKKRRYPKYVSAFKDRKREGPERLRFRKGLVSHYFRSQYGTPSFEAEYRACLEELPLTDATPAFPPHSVGWVVQQFYQSSRWLSFKDSTRYTHRRKLDRFVDTYGLRDIRQLKAIHLDAIFARMLDTPASAANLRALLKQVFGWAVKHQLMRENPATGTDPISQPPDSGFHTFTDDEIKQLRAFWPVGSRERVLIEIASAWGARRSDLYRLGWKHIEGNFLVWDQTKTRADHGLPVPASVWEVIRDLPRDAPAFVVSNKGVPYTVESLGNFFRKLRSKAGLKVGGLHSFREKLGADAAEAGASDAEIGAVLGHTSARTAQKYRRKANRRKMAVAVFNKLSHMGESGDNPDEPIPSKD